MASRQPRGAWSRPGGIDAGGEAALWVACFFLSPSKHVPRGLVMELFPHLCLQLGTQRQEGGLDLIAAAGHCLAGAGHLAAARGPFGE